MYLTLLILPLLGSISAGLFGRKIGIYGSQIITILCLILSSILSTFVFYEVAVCASPLTINLLSWIDSEILLVNWSFMFDQLTVSMILMVCYISTVVHIYAVSYMKGDPHIQRFFSYLSLFTFFMLILVSGANYLIMFIGWEGIGVSSYLLINYFYTRIQANKAAILAFTQNRVGDMFLSIAFFALFALFGSLDYSVIFSSTPYMNENAISIICLLLFLGAGAKSAVLFLHNWLPGSMEAPTPVSSLLHAATLVTAGIYLLIRSSPILEFSPTMLFVITIMGALTSFFAATTGLLQNDIKRIIAFSTISQLGYMFIAIGISQYQIALFHMMNHAFFKALLFLGAGAVIHAMADEQDVRKHGGLINFLPFIYSAMLIGSLSLMALPWLTGFYSKDLILELAYGQYSLKGYVAWILGTLTAMITAFYSFRLISLTFLGYPNGPKKNYNNIHEADIYIIIPLLFLASFSIFLGFIANDAYIGVGSDFMGASLFQHPNNVNLIEAGFSLPILIKLLPAFVTIFGASLALLFYLKYPSFLVKLTENKLGYAVYTFLNGKYLLDVIYNNYIIRGGLSLGYLISKYLDRGVLEFLGPHGLTLLLNRTSNKMSKLDNGFITNYAAYTIISLLIMTVIIMNFNYLSFYFPNHTLKTNDNWIDGIFFLSLIFVIFLITPFLKIFKKSTQ